MARTPVLGTGHFPGSSPGLPTIYGVVAQSGEHLSGRQDVASSILVNSTTISGYRTAWPTPRDSGSRDRWFESSYPDHIRAYTYFFCFGSRCLLVRVQPSRPLPGSRQIGKAGDYQSGHYAPLTQLVDVASSNLAFSQFESEVEYHNKNAKIAVM